MQHTASHNTLPRAKHSKQHSKHDDEEEKRPLVQESKQPPPVAAASSWPPPAPPLLPSSNAIITPAVSYQTDDVPAASADGLSPSSSSSSSLSGSSHSLAAALLHKLPALPTLAALRRVQEQEQTPMPCGVKGECRRVEA